MHRAVYALVLWCLWGMTAYAGPISATYTCERSVKIPTVFAQDKDAGSIVVMILEGALIQLAITPAASGARYADTTDQSGYVWWTKAEAATLSWFDAQTGQETFVYRQCRKSDDEVPG
ncbi:hypothetical protein ROLI_019730 [Roseobacter fucihabitans]|uniref:C-type lysozyme inhibitor domain-containing protein n=1 Tax=Roseobacter fucihabitans TaxID=1537242 RepID=A0ABZ2BSD2_9RHOB|nr:MliC family protein [Roseobacter litoralis]MBC6966187.1 Membrane-bound lysozyme-inhibitor of c-type lysozyme [Roseobacter litoralis]